MGMPGDGEPEPQTEVKIDQIRDTLVEQTDRDIEQYGFIHPGTLIGLVLCSIADDFRFARKGVEAVLGEDEEGREILAKIRGT
jgi:hypothetical protein